jgi:hypothetical protein
MVAGWVYLRLPTAGSIGRFRDGISPAPDYGDETPRAVPRSSRPRDRDIDDVVAQSRAAMSRKPAPAPAVPVVRPPASSAPAASALDAVLDKIAASGMESLTSAERAVLEEWSQRLRGTN